MQELFLFQKAFAQISQLHPLTVVIAEYNFKNFAVSYKAVS